MSSRPARAAKARALEKVRGLGKKKRTRRGRAHAVAQAFDAPSAASSVTASLQVYAAGEYTEQHWEVNDLLAARKDRHGNAEVLAKWVEWVPVTNLGDAHEAQNQIATLLQRQGGWTPPANAENTVGILSDAPAQALFGQAAAMLSPPASPATAPLLPVAQPEPFQLGTDNAFDLPAGNIMASLPAPHEPSLTSVPTESAAASPSHALLDRLNLHPSPEDVASEWTPAPPELVVDEGVPSLEPDADGEDMFPLVTEPQAQPEHECFSPESIQDESPTPAPGPETTVQAEDPHNPNLEALGALSFDIFIGAVQAAANTISTPAVSLTAPTQQSQVRKRSEQGKANQKAKRNRVSRVDCRDPSRSTFQTRRALRSAADQPSMSEAHGEQA
ncbi:hypothetical protein OC835_006029 [Tilletia horrida]|nr:hypothetical protein OC835_006029 [Tilletia horrida]